MEVVTYRVTCISPLLMHSAKGMMEEKVDKIGKKNIPTAADEAEAGAYRLPDGQLFLPSEAFRSSLIRGATGRRIGKTSAGVLFSGSVFEVDMECPLFDPTCKDKPLHDYAIDIRRAVVQRQGVARARAVLKDWACNMSFEYDPDFIKVDWITEVFGVAGKTKGVGDYRPEKKGRFGRYTVELI